MKRWALMLCALAALGNCGWADSAWERDKLVMAAQVDLDGDGRRENIRLAPFKTRRSDSDYWDASYYRLTVNEKVIFRANLDKIEGFYIADINRRDRYKEIVVNFSGPSGSSGEEIFAYVGTKLRRVHQGVLSDLKFKGNGIVIATRWIDPWSTSDTYRLNARHTLTYLPQKFHRVGLKTRLFKALALHSYQQINSIKRVLPVGTSVEITRSDRQGWFEIRARHGTRGWITRDEIDAHMRDNIDYPG